MKARGRLWIGVGALAAAVLLAVHWLDDERARGAPIRVAFAGPTSGPSTEDGLVAMRAIELVFERINAEGGVSGRPLLLDVYDDANDAEKARANAPGISDQSDTVAVVGHHYSTSSPTCIRS